MKIENFDLFEIFEIFDDFDDDDDDDDDDNDDENDNSLQQSYVVVRLVEIREKNLTGHSFILFYYYFAQRDYTDH